MYILIVYTCGVSQRTKKYKNINLLWIFCVIYVKTNTSIVYIFFNKCEIELNSNLININELKLFAV